MKKVILFSLALAALCVTSCDEVPVDDIINNSGQSEMLIVEGETVEFDCNRNIYTFAVMADGDYDIVIPVDWVSQITTKAVHTDSVSLEISANTGFYPRECDIKIQVRGNSGIQDSIHLYQEEGLNSLAKALKADESVSLFYQAMVLTGMIDSIRGYIDETFFCPQPFPTIFNANGNSYSVVHMDTLFIKYTVFCETDFVLSEKYGINTIEQLYEYALQVYETDSDFSDDYTDRSNPLNKFISYHILPMGISYNQLNTVNKVMLNRSIKWDEIDIEDYYMPMMNHSVLKVSTPYHTNQRYLNRKGTEFGGIAVDSCGITADNGYAYYISDVLTYSRQVRENVLDTRIRASISTIIPELMTNGARDFSHIQDGHTLLSFGDEYKRSFTTMSDYCVLYMGYPVEYLLRYLGQFVFLYCDIRDYYDISFKLPAVPNDGEYEIRLRQGIPSWLRHEEGEIECFINDMSCNTHINEADRKAYDKWEQTDIKSLNNQELMAAEDTLRAHGFMRDLASYATQNGEAMRDIKNWGRVILCSDFYMSSDQDYYLRIRGSSINLSEPICIDMLEIVPKHIYDGPEREDPN